MAIWNKDWIRKQIQHWLAEDIGTGDITTLVTIAESHQSVGVIHAKEDGIIAGIPVASLVFEVVDPSLRFTPKVEDGMKAARGTVLAEVEGKTHSILTGERLALNLLQRMSGIATKTRTFVEALGGRPVRLVDTRKTTPGHRMLEKYAVRIGGGHNHRFGLYDAVMIKDNHIKAAGGVAQAIRAARNSIPHTMKIEVETETMEQVREAAEAGADIIMLDNMDLSTMRQAVAEIKSIAPLTIVEASGGVTLQTVCDIADTGVDVISVGGLTYSFKSLDISLDLNGKKEVRV
jgi:nicotinate-nucleotide pyrophosphorylase (carboxylating)